MWSDLVEILHMFFNLPTEMALTQSIRRMSRHVQVNNPARSQFNNGEELNLAKEEGNHLQELTRPDVLSVIVEEN